MAALDLQGASTRDFGARALQLPNENLGLSGLDEGTPNTIISSTSHSNLISFLGRVNYGYSSKYLFTFSFRADGSSTFPTGNKFSYFASGAASWRFSQ